MTHRFPLKEIAFQAGLSLATVDRVVHDRPGVRAVTRARVGAAISELERQLTHAPARGGKMSVDLVMEAPKRFQEAVRAAFEAEMPALRPASLRARFHMAETMPAAEIAAVLRQIRKRGSQGVILKAPREAGVIEAAQSLMALGIPILTYVTDLPAPCRIGYVGIDNKAAGAAAGWLMGNMLSERPCEIMVTMSRAEFAGEGDRMVGFRTVIEREFQHLEIVEVPGGQGLLRETRDTVLAALREAPGIGAVYSVGGANRAILDAFAEAQRDIRVLAAHDLDRTNRELLRLRKLTFVLHHDLRHDARLAGQMFLRHHRMLPQSLEIPASQVFIATPGDV